jgi:hypothetical protein
VATVALYAVIVAVSVRQDLVQDTWLTLVGGRDVAQHGIPHRDSLFVWTYGRPWVNQQWLGQLFFYGLYLAGGIRVVLLAHVGMLVTAAAVLVATARARGASPKAILLTGSACLLLAPWGLQARAQTIGELLFALWLALLLIPGPLTLKRASALLLVLVIWANVHGSVMLAVVLTIGWGVTLLISQRGRERRAAWILVVASPLCVFASPYGTDLVGYYHRLLLNPALPRFVNEWRAPVPSRATAAFYAVLLGTAWLLGRAGRKLPIQDKVIVVLLGVSALEAIRSIVWFALAAVPIVAPLLDDLVGGVRVLNGRAAGRLGVACGTVAVVACIVVFAHPTGWFLEQWPAPAAARAATFAQTHPGAEIVSDSRYADWLLWSVPGLRDRIAYDVRFELFTPAQFQALTHADTSPTPKVGSHRPTLVVFDPRSERCNNAARCRFFYRDSYIAVAQTQAKPANRQP